MTFTVQAAPIMNQNRRNLKTLLLEVVMLLVTAFVFSLAFPSFISERGFGFLALFCLIPLFAVIRNTTLGLSAAYGFFFGFVFYLFFNYWLATFHALAIILVPFIKAVEMVLLFVALKLADMLFKKRSYVVQALLWVAYAYLSQSWFAGYPYGSIAYALYNYRVLIQIADFSGIWLITFLMILPQAFIGQWVWNKRNNVSESFKTYLLSDKITVLGYCVAMVFTIVYGIINIAIWNNKTPDMIWKVAVVQHNADSWKGGYPTYKRNFNNLRKMTYEALATHPDIDLMLWSETAFVPSVSWHTNYPDENDSYDTKGLVEEFVEFGKGLSVPLVTGNPEGVIDGDEAYTEDGSWNRKDYNTVIFFEDGQIKKTYRKQHLVPFTEHFPYEKSLPWLYNLLLANDYHWWEKGDESVVFETESGVKFSTPICFEDVFGYLNADFVKAGADVILNMTNDSWSGAVSAEMQHAAIAVFRSIENRRTTVRSTNSGISCTITPTGKIQDMMEPFKMYWQLYNVPVYSSENLTLYTQYSDLIAIIISIVANAILVGGAVLWLVNKKKK